MRNLFQDNYFIPAKSGKNAKGSLYTKFNNVISLYKAKGLISKTSSQLSAPTQATSQLPAPAQASTSTADSNIVTTEQQKDTNAELNKEEKKDWLARFNKPWEIVENYWFHIRRL